MQKFMLLIAIVLGIGTFAPSAAGRRTAKQRRTAAPKVKMIQNT
jgi:hypothetical protein